MYVVVVVVVVVVVFIVSTRWLGNVLVVVLIIRMSYFVAFKNSFYILHLYIASECAAGDEVYERAVNMVTTVYRLEGADKDSLQFVPIHENSNKMVTVDILHTKQVRRWVLLCLLDL